ncbi:uncharacterized protein [Linepithema humile]|uniref:uncharacterized protein n=1 Tax=Linepithema humile TaxID=83485 RepID=UPI000623A6DA|nr:PREDICTED: uncharacterized protein LOC105679560 [Linepithema humile]
MPTCLQQARLPRIDLPKFNGTPADWLSFKDLFQALVLDNSTLTPVAKLQYLKTSLTGSAAPLLKNTTLIADNFEKAWQSVISFYENKRLLVNAALNSLLTVRRMTKESASEMEQLYTQVLQIHRSLETLQRPVSMWDDFLVFIVSQRFDSESIKAWELHLGSSKNPPTWTQLCEFLVTRLRSLQALEKTRFGKPHVKRYTNAIKAHYQGKNKENIPNKNYKCLICSGNHHTSICSQYSSKSRAQKLALIAKHKLCYNCLGPHRIINCSTTRRCQKCGKRHHTTIHPCTTQPAKSTDNNQTKQPEAQVLHSSTGHKSILSQTLLATAQVLIFSPYGNFAKSRVLIDQGSEISLITERLVQRLRLPRIRSFVPLIGIGEQTSNKTKGLVHFKIKPHFRSNYKISVSAHILPNLTSSIPTVELAQESWSHLNGLLLADPQFCSPGPIDIILGADLYGQIIEEGIVKGLANSPIAQSTTLEWIVSGPTSKGGSQQTLRSYYISSNEEICHLMQKFWEVESVPETHRNSLTAEEQTCENHFIATHSRDTHGRYIVKLPFKSSVKNLGDSKRKATLLCSKLIKRCSTDSKYAQLYSEFMTKYQKLRHMIQVPLSMPEPDNAFYLPQRSLERK